MVMKTSFWNLVLCFVAFIHMMSHAHGQQGTLLPSSVKFLTQFNIAHSTETNKDIVQQNVVQAIQQVLLTLHAPEIVLHLSNVTVH